MYMAVMKKPTMKKKKNLTTISVKVPTTKKLQVITAAAKYGKMVPKVGKFQQLSKSTVEVSTFGFLWFLFCFILYFNLPTI